MRAAVLVAAPAQMSQDQPQAQLVNHHHVNGVQPQPDQCMEAETTTCPSTTVAVMSNGAVTSGAAAAVAEVEPRVPAATVEEPLPAGLVTVRSS